MEQLIAHMFGDYVLQSDWMANKKTSQWLPALCHAAVYTLCFAFLSLSWKALLVIGVTHLLIDRFRLVRYLCWLKNFLAPKATFKHWREEFVGPGGATLYKECEGLDSVWWYPWSECTSTGYHKERPPWMAVWLMIFADNSLHLLINFLAMRYL